MKDETLEKIIRRTTCVMMTALVIGAAANKYVEDLPRKYQSQKTENVKSYIYVAKPVNQDKNYFIKPKTFKELYNKL